MAWACNLLADIVGHFEKRNLEALSHYDPANLDRARLDELMDRYADGPIAARRDRLDETLGFLSDPDEDPATLDEWAPSGIGSVDDIVRVFTDQCFFGCEADDPMNALAFDPRINPDGARLRAMFASDIGHWDVPDFTGVLPEAWELVEDGLVDLRSVPRLHLRQRGPALHRDQPRLLRRHGRRRRRQGAAQPDELTTGHRSLEEVQVSSI